MGTIYIVKNKVNNKYYVGQTTRDFSNRFREHTNAKDLLGNAIRKYGVDNFNKEVLENIPEEYLDYIEKDLIKECNSIYPNGYNLQDGGCKNKHHHKETKIKISEIHKTFVGNKNSFFGKHHSNETKKKISEAHKGQHPTEETKKKISEANKGEKNPMFGKHFTEESKKKMSEAKIGYLPWNTGKHLSQEEKKKISEAHKGQHPTEETKRKMSESQKRRHKKEDDEAQMA
jgi:NUMOD3 motif/GIY-YIG catalytic domain